MKYDKRRLLQIAGKVISIKPITPDEIVLLLEFDKKQDEGNQIKFIKHVALPISLVVGFFFAAFPDTFNSVSNDLPSWTNLTPEMLAGIDYFWDIIGEPVGKLNIIFHLPNIILYSFGIVGIKKLVDSIDRKTWVDKVLEAQNELKERINSGTNSLKLNKGHSILFIGASDFIGMQHALNHKSSESVTISENKPKYTNIWLFYKSTTLFDDLKKVLILADCGSAGEYIFFPVKDDQIFLPSNKAYDLSPHMLAILCQNIRTIEKEMDWPAKKIIVIGDKFHKSFVHSVDNNKAIPKSADIISLYSLSEKHENVSIIDPSDVIIKEIIKISKGRKIVFRATKEGIKEYRKRFFIRLKKAGYTSKNKTKGILTIGYDLFEDQTEQQTLSRAIDDYLPIVLSKNVKDALVKNGYKKEEFIYVPELVLITLSVKAKEQ